MCGCICPPCAAPISRRNWTSPSTLAGCFSWHFQLIEASCNILGKDYVKSRLADLADAKISTMFSGLDMAAQAWEMLQAAALEVLGVDIGARLTSMAEIEPSCQRFLVGNWPDRCCFADVRDWVSAPPRDEPEWNLEQMQLHRVAFCVAHQKKCKLYPRMFMDVSGPPCVLWSRLAAVFNDERSLSGATAFNA